MKWRKLNLGQAKDDTAGMHLSSVYKEDTFFITHASESRWSIAFIHNNNK